MQSTGKELPAVSCVGYNKKDETIFPAGTSNLQKAKVERLSLHMQVFGKRRALCAKLPRRAAAMRSM